MCRRDRRRSATVIDATASVVDPTHRPGAPARPAPRPDRQPERPPRAASRRAGRAAGAAAESGKRAGAEPPARGRGPGQAVHPGCRTLGGPVHAHLDRRPPRHASRPGRPRGPSLSRRGPDGSTGLISAGVIRLGAGRRKGRRCPEPTTCWPWPTDSGGARSPPPRCTPSAPPPVSPRWPTGWPSCPPSPTCRPSAPTTGWSWSTPAAPSWPARSTGPCAAGRRAGSTPPSTPTGTSTTSSACRCGQPSRPRPAGPNRWWWPTRRCPPGSTATSSPPATTASSTGASSASTSLEWPTEYRYPDRTYRDRLDLDVGGRRRRAPPRQGGDRRPHLDLVPRAAGAVLRRPVHLGVAQRRQPAEGPALPARMGRRPASDARPLRRAGRRARGPAARPRLPGDRGGPGPPGPRRHR